MYINKIYIDSEHWTSEYIPISYIKILNTLQLKKSLTLYWHDNYELNAICRLYFISNNNIEIGDLWINEKLRGKIFNNTNKKISFVFLQKVISKIWKYYPKCKKITLKVHNNNLPAIKLYNSLNFIILKKNISNKSLNMKNNGILMIRFKKI